TDIPTAQPTEAQTEPTVLSASCEEPSANDEEPAVESEQATAAAFHFPNLEIDAAPDPQLEIEPFSVVRDVPVAVPLHSTVKEIASAQFEIAPAPPIMVRCPCCQATMQVPVNYCAECGFLFPADAAVTLAVDAAAPVFLSPSMPPMSKV